MKALHTRWDQCALKTGMGRLRFLFLHLMGRASRHLTSLHSATPPHPPPLFLNHSPHQSKKQEHSRSADWTRGRIRNTHVKPFVVVPTPPFFPPVTIRLSPPQRESELTGQPYTTYSFCSEPLPSRASSVHYSRAQRDTLNVSPLPLFSLLIPSHASSAFWTLIFPRNKTNIKALSRLHGRHHNTHTHLSLSVTIVSRLPFLASLFASANLSLYIYISSPPAHSLTNPALPPTILLSRVSLIIIIQVASGRLTHRERRTTV